MSEGEPNDKPFSIDRAKLGRAACKKCKEKCLKGDIRIAKLTPSPYGEGKMKNWFHLDCLFEQFLKQRPTTQRLLSSVDLEGWDDLNDEDKQELKRKVEECEKLIAEKYKTDYKHIEFEASYTPQKAIENNTSPQKIDKKDALFREFRRLVANITNESSYIEKTALVNTIFTKGVDGKGFHGDIEMWVRLLLPGVIKRIYNLQSKQLIKLFSRIFHTDHSDMLKHLEKGDIGETIQHFYEHSTYCIPPKKSQLTLREVDDFLENLSQLTREEDQINHFEIFISKCTSNDLKIIIRLIKHDLRMNAGAKHILEGVHPEAYESYQSTRDLKLVLERCAHGNKDKGIMLLTPVLPMLAEPCKSIEQAMNKCPNGMYSEIKYDGERVQLHKKGKEFKYYSRSLKPVLAHKVNHFKDYIPEAFPHGKDLILDCEILMVDSTNGKPLPFGTLGVHKKSEFKDASVCLFIFDCIYYNGEDLTSQPLRYRKQILKENMIEIPNHIVFSEMKEIHNPYVLADMVTYTIKNGLEGLVLKDLESIYEPGKRHWLKVKKDYLFDGALADSADLIVLGAWYGTGKKGGIMSIFLMGVYDAKTKRFKTVTKVHTGHDDKTLDRLQSELEMEKISSDPNRVPNWLKCTKTMIPDFVAKDPKKQPVWEVTGAEFTKQHDVHTADGISIRFPRVTKMRDDKTWETATNLEELNELFTKSKENFDGSYFSKELEKMNYPKPTEEEMNENKTTIKKVEESNNKIIKNGILSKRESRKRSSSEESLQIPKRRKVKISDPLPNFFGNVNLFILNDFSEETHKKVLRLFMAYGGEILNDTNITSATHILHNSDFVSQQSGKCPKTALHVTYKWLYDSITNQCLQTEYPYVVKLIPSSAK